MITEVININKNMKNILILVFVFLTTFSFGQGTVSDDVNPDTLELFKNNPALDIYGMLNSYRSATLLHEQLELTKRLDIYRKKQNKRLWLGGGMMGAGMLGIWYVAEMDEPIYQTGNQVANDAADEQKKKRKMIAWPSALLAGAGAILYVDSFKFSKWTKLELGLANIKITHEIYGLGGRKYFKGKESEIKLKRKSIWRKSYPRYRN